MPHKALMLRPGVNTLATQLLNTGGWSRSNLIRVRDGGFMEKLGGWQALFSAPIDGLCRGLHAYQGLQNDDYLLIGTTQALQIYYNGTLYNLLLGGVIRDLVADPGWLTATASSDVYQVTDPANGRSPGDLVQIVLPVSVGGSGIGVGGVTLFPQTVTVLNVVDADNYTFIGNKTAITSNLGGFPPAFTADSANNIFLIVAMFGHDFSEGDTFTVQLGLIVGGVTITPGNYLVQTVIDGDHFTIKVSPQHTTGPDSVYELEDESQEPLGRLSYTQDIPAVNNWFLDNFGNVALLCYENGPIFTWTPPPSSGLFATLLPAPAPQASAGMFVAMPQAQIICFGAEINGIQDALLLRWCDAGDYTVWVADAANQAGSFRLSRGSKIVGALQAPQVTLVWTDIDLWSMQYVGPPFIYSFTIISSGCGLIAPRAATTLHNITYWMSQRQFFVFGGNGVQSLPCPVWDDVFDDLDAANISKCFAGSNSAFNEVWFFYPSESGGTTECDSYAKYNVNTQTWDIGKLDRTAWIDQTVFGPPIGTDTAQIVQQHEVGFDANGIAMRDVYLESGFVDLGEGGADILFIDQIIPDLKWFGENGSIIITLYLQQYPGGGTVMQGPFTVTPTTRYISLRVRARLAAFKISWGETKGFSARLGAITYRSSPMGKRP